MRRKGFQLSIHYHIVVFVGTVVFRVVASDADSPDSDLTFDFSSNTFHLLSNGDVVLKKTLNYEVCAAYSVLHL